MMSIIEVYSEACPGIAVVFDPARGEDLMGIFIEFFFFSRLALRHSRARYMKQSNAIPYDCTL